MKIDLDIPPTFESALREEWGDLAQAIKEAIAIGLVEVSALSCTCVE